MSLDWPTADFCSLALLFSAGRPAWTRIWLCRQRIAARTSSTFCAVGITSVLVHTGTWATVALPAFLAAAALALALTAGFLAPSATVALTLVSFLWVLASAGEATRRPAATKATASFLVSTARVPSRVGSVAWFRRPDAPWRHASFGSPAGSGSPVALRPTLADGLPLSGSGTSCCPLDRQVLGNLHSAAILAGQRGVAQPG